MASITEAAAGFPNSSGHIPFECGNVAEVLGERGWNTYMVGKWHLCPEDEMNLASTQAPVAARARASSGSTASSGPRPTSGIPTSSTTTTRSSSRPRPRRATTSARTSPTRRWRSSGTRRRSRRTSRSSSTTAPAPATRPHHAPEGVGRTGTRASSTWATRPTASRSSSGRRRSASCPSSAELSPINPYIDRDERGRQGLAGARHGPALGLAHRRREAAVRADGRGVRRLPEPRRPRDRAAARLPGGRAASSTTP